MQSLQLDRAEDPVNVEKDLHGVRDLGHAQDEVCLHTGAETWRILNLAGSNVQHVSHAIDDDARVELLPWWVYTTMMQVCEVISSVRIANLVRRSTTGMT